MVSLVWFSMVFPGVTQPHRKTKYMQLVFRFFRLLDRDQQITDKIKWTFASSFRRKEHGLYLKFPPIIIFRYVTHKFMQNPLTWWPQNVSSAKWCSENVEIGISSAHSAFEKLYFPVGSWFNLEMLASLPTPKSG